MTLWIKLFCYSHYQEIGRSLHCLATLQLTQMSFEETIKLKTGRPPAYMLMVHLNVVRYHSQIIGSNLHVYHVAMGCEMVSTNWPAVYLELIKMFDEHKLS